MIGCPQGDSSMRGSLLGHGLLLCHIGSWVGPQYQGATPPSKVTSGPLLAPNDDTGVYRRVVLVGGLTGDLGSIDWQWR